VKILLDTSILVAAIVEDHPDHEKGMHWCRRVADGTDKGFVSAHSLAELYAILTTLPVQPRISPQAAHYLIQKNVLEKFDVVVLSGRDYVEVLEMLAGIGVTGGATYDALILRTALNAEVDMVVTLNEKDFRRVYPDLADKIVAP
jgi:predicted nucleic acid-binding protein